MKLFLFFFLLVSGCSIYAQIDEKTLSSFRPVTDTVGFVHKDWQMDSLMARVERLYGNGIDSSLQSLNIGRTVKWKTAVCPHDDYIYAGNMYPLVLRNLNAKTIIIIGVCHKARQFNLENKIVFDSFQYWHGPYGPVKVSDYREQIMKQLEPDVFVVNDEVQAVEHSVEAMIPFLQFYNRDVEIISILVPYMDYSRMDEISAELASAIEKVYDGKSWGNDYAILISNDAVHYGSKDWGDSSFAFLGEGEKGYANAMAKENEIIDQCFTKKISLTAIRQFINYTVNTDDLKSYKWTWCGRFSVPFGMLLTFYLQEKRGLSTECVRLGYSTSIDHPHLPVEDIGIGHTAPAHIDHWVGYAAIGFR